MTLQECRDKADEEGLAYFISDWVNPDDIEDVAFREIVRGAKSALDSAEAYLSARTVGEGDEDDECDFEDEDEEDD